MPGEIYQTNNNVPTQPVRGGVGNPVMLQPRFVTQVTEIPESCSCVRSADGGGRNPEILLSWLWPRSGQRLSACPGFKADDGCQVPRRPHPLSAHPAFAYVSAHP